VSTQNDIRIIRWIEILQSRGLYAFSLDLLAKELPDYSSIAIKRSLSRLSEKGKILSIHKGYYLILPPQYAAKGTLPPALFLDAFMKHLERPYYVALLNAAAYHGASHQQPQEFFVMTNFPVLRPTHKKGMKLNYISIKELPATLIEQRKSEAGYLNISNPALTAVDLIQYEKRIGGLNRAATVLLELAEVLKPADFNTELLKYAHVTSLQRLGYLLEFVCSDLELSESLFKSMIINELNLYRIPLKASAKIKGFSSGNRWNVIVNAEIEIDE
jgi:predicted transcriptional regulator of viral defense system